MRVLHVGLCCTHGGAESVVANLVREQVAQGLDVEVAFRSDWGAAGQYKDVCPVRFLNKETLGDYLLRNPFDVVHAATHAANWLAPALHASRYQGAVVVTSHAMGFSETSLPTDIAVAVSEAVAKSIRAVYGDRVQVIYNGVDLTLFYPPENAGSEVPTIAWVGRSNDPMKGFDLMLASVQSVLLKSFRVVIVDGSPEGKECRDSLPAGVDFIPRKNWRDMPAFYRSLAASKGMLLSTSQMEGLGMTILEAQACGCPVVAPRVDGIPEVIEHRKTGYLYERDEGVAGIEEAIRWLYAEGNYEKVSQAAAQSARERFSARRMADQYQAVYLEALRSHPGLAQAGVVQRNALWVSRITKRKARNVRRRFGRLARQLSGGSAGSATEKSLSSEKG